MDWSTRIRKAHLLQLLDLALQTKDEEWFLKITERLKELENVQSQSMS